MIDLSLADLLTIVAVLLGPGVARYGASWLAPPPPIAEGLRS